jgi:hypothetical protein
VLAFKTRLLLAPRAAITLIRLLGREVAPAIGAAAVVQLGLAHITSLTGSQKPTVARTGASIRTVRYVRSLRLTHGRLGLNPVSVP